MAEPLARDEDRGADVEPERVVLERRPVPLAEEEANQTAVGVVHLLLAAGDPRGVDDGEIARHRLVQPDETVVEHLDRARVGDGAGHDIHTNSTLTAASVGADAGYS